MATHSGVLAWEIPWTEEPGELQSIGLQRAGHDLTTKEQQSITSSQISFKNYVCVFGCVQFTSVQSLSHVQLFAIP